MKLKNNYITLPMLEKALVRNNAAIKVIVDESVDGLAVITKQNFELMEKRFEKIGKKLEGMDSRIIGINSRIDDIAESYMRKPVKAAA